MTYAVSSWIFLKLLGLIYLIAFISLAVQIQGIAGSRGIEPARELFGYSNTHRFKAFLKMPTLLWWNTSDRFLNFLCWGGALLSVLLIFGIAPVLILILLYLFYLSLEYACGIFLAYQWDALLLEIGFLSIFLAPPVLFDGCPPVHDPSPIARFLLVWLLFRLMLSSGLAKWDSRDPAWRDFTALKYHYETQPLPTPLAWYFHQYPEWFQKTSCGFMFLVEIAVPFLLFAPLPISYLASGLIVFLMVLIMLTGNYCFFNLQAIALCVLVIPDWGRVSPYPAPLAWTLISAIVGIPLFIFSLDVTFRIFRKVISWPALIERFWMGILPFRLVNRYGLFSVMTTERPEIIVEGSEDGIHWKEYEFKWKAGNVYQPPKFVAPYQPRLDWQMWFAALASYEDYPWFMRFLSRLLEGSESVLKLLAKNPFPGKPPKYIRALLYDYTFTNVRERAVTRAWWKRELIASYAPPLTVRG